MGPPGSSPAEKLMLHVVAFKMKTEMPWGCVTSYSLPTPHPAGSWGMELGQTLPSLTGFGGSRQGIKSSRFPSWKEPEQILS